jgi:predicted RNA polymerase sigma factor
MARRLGFLEEAVKSYRRAIELVRQEPERDIWSIGWQKFFNNRT